jgi:hypothetical protein
MLKIAKFDQGKLEREVMHLGTSKFLVDYAINEPGCCAGFIEFDMPNEKAFPFGHNEVHYVKSGRAEYTFTSFPKHMEERKAVVDEGDLILIQYGTAIKWRPLDKPFVVACVVMPMPEVPYQPFDVIDPASD